MSSPLYLPGRFVEASRQPVELLALALGQPAEEVLGIGVDRLLDLRLAPPAGGGERDHVGATILRVAIAPDVAGPLQVVDRGDHRRATVALTRDELGGPHRLVVEIEDLADVRLHRQAVPGGGHAAAQGGEVQRAQACAEALDAVEP